MDAKFLRGFSNTFVPETKVEVMDLKLVETAELDRNWKAARRQRLKQQEDKIWEDFVAEKDVLKSMVMEDPYQFLEQLPEACIKDLMENEIMKKDDDLKEQKRGSGDYPRNENQLTTLMAFNGVDSDEIFQIFDEDKEDDLSIQEDDTEGLNETLDTPNTVRERAESPGSSKGSPQLANSGHTLQQSSSKSSENVAGMIENSIYCARVKELRIKIGVEINSISDTLDSQNVGNIDPHLLRKMSKRSSEFANRFNRIHVYQLQRQIYDIKRHNSLTLPFAKHTQFQSQMVRIVNLHQNTMQALQVFHKSIEQTACLRESATALFSVCDAIREGTAVAAATSPPQNLTAATCLYNDDLIATCEKLETCVKQYTSRISDFVDVAENSQSIKTSKKIIKSKMKKKSNVTWSKSLAKANPNKMDVNTRLSMYSLETLQRRQTSKGGNSSRDLIGDKGSGKKDKNETPRSHRRSRRPLMRDPHSGRGPRLRRPNNDNDISTMVEVVEPPSSQVSREVSPRRRAPHPPSSRAHSPSPRELPPPLQGPLPTHTESPQTKSPKSIASPGSSRVLPKRLSPYIKPANTIRSDTQETIEDSNSIAPVSKIQCAKKHLQKHENTNQNDIEPRNHRGGKNSHRSGFGSHRSGNETYRTGEARTITAKNSMDSARVSNTARSNVDSARHSQELKLAIGRENSMVNTARSTRGSDRKAEADLKNEQDPTMGCEVTRLLRQLCGGDPGPRNERHSTGAKNAQLISMNGSSPRAPSTPQLLRILEETIKKKVPKSLYKKPKDADRLRLAFNIPQRTADNLFQYRTKFVQHMLASSMYANSAVGKPWEMIGSVAERIIDEMLLKCAREMEIKHVIMDLYKTETK